MNVKRLIRRSSLMILMTLLYLTAYAQQRQITGTVKDASGEPMIGVNLLIQGTTNGTITDLDGKFTLKDVTDKEILVVTYIGYQTQKIAVGARSNFQIVLTDDSKALDEVVVVGYGVQKKSDLTGSVGSVNSDAIVSKGATSIAESLQGSVAGVDISQASSRAGDGFNIQIRGKSSLAGGSPLYVIDGVVSDNMDFLNPVDIEKVDVLKDASSTAIYGSRATNGVVIITTKQGATNTTQGAKAVISYDGYYGYKQLSNMPEFMDGEEWTNYRFQRYATVKNTVDGIPEFTMTDAKLKAFWCNNSPKIAEMVKNKAYYDWPDLVTQDGHQQNHFLSISGSTPTLSYRIGLGYQQEEGVMTDKYDRWNIKGVIDHKINQYLSTGLSVNFATALKDFSGKHAVRTGFRMSPWAIPYYWEGENQGDLILLPMKDPLIYPNGGGPTGTVNPLVDRKNSADETRTYDVLSNVYLQVTPVKEVILKTTFSPSYFRSHRGEFYGVNTDARSGAGTNQAKITNIDRFSYTWDTQANFIKSFGDHSLNALGLISVYSNVLEGDMMQAENMPFDVNWYNMGSGDVTDKNSYYEKLTMLSYVLRLNYSYQGKYMATVSSRWDGSSKFQKDNRWGAFPSAALAWRLSEEAFLRKEWLSNLKLRASYGLTGNNANVGPYDTQALAETKYWYNWNAIAANGYGPNGVTNSLLSWEKTQEVNLGLDFGFLNNRISGSVDWYNKVSKDLLMEQQIPLEIGSSTGAMINNIGKVRNRGLEVALSTVNIQTRDFRWETTFTFATNKNEILELNGEKKDLVGNRWFIGQPIDVVYDYELAGVCTADEAKAYAANSAMKTKFLEGEMKVKDQQKEGEEGYGVIDENDLVIRGHALPKWTGSFTSNMYYKGFDFSFSLYTRQGGHVQSPFMQEFTEYKDRGRTKLKMDYYIPAGAPMIAADGTVYTNPTTINGSYPYPHENSKNNQGGGAFWGYGDNRVTSPQTIVDNSFVRVKNITLGYTFPKQWLSKAHISKLRVYANVLNPFTFTNYKGFDPEWADADIVNSSVGGPATRTYQVGLNLQF